MKVHYIVTPAGKEGYEVEGKNLHEELNKYVTNIQANLAVEDVMILGKFKNSKVSVLRVRNL